jgi:putative holliday junction resolvase
MKKAKVLAIDYGTKRVGLASGNFSLKIASPKGILQNKGKNLFLEIIDFCREWEVDLIVVGLPLNMREDQEENEMIRNVNYFVKKLKENLEETDDLKEIEIELFDERLSSFEADSLKGDAQHKDDFAAQVILQRYFDQV